MKVLEGVSTEEMMGIERKDNEEVLWHVTGKRYRSDSSLGSLRGNSMGIHCNLDC
jgi:hypothetical protein